MDKKIIRIWVNKNNNHDWMQYASKIDCRNRKGYEIVGYIGYNVRNDGEYTIFEIDNAWGMTTTERILTINIDSVEERVKNV